MKIVRLTFLAGLLLGVVGAHDGVEAARGIVAHPGAGHVAVPAPRDVAVHPLPSHVINRSEVEFYHPNSGVKNRSVREETERRKMVGGCEPGVC